MPALLSSVVLRTTVLLICSNVFMTFAWYAHLRNLSGRPWYVAAAGRAVDAELRPGRTD
jgi:uncharacterized protein (DUF486 family)